MSISSELLTLQNTKTAIRTAINNKGGSVEASAPFASYATAIQNLPSGGDNSTLIDLIERDITSITIPSGTTSIGNNAFSFCSSLTSVTIPNSVTTIGNAAFQGCGSFTSITIPNNVTSIGNFAFQSCTSFTSITIPNNVTSIGNSAFDYCTSLTSATIGNSVTSIGDAAFNSCTSLTSIIIPSSVTTIGSRAFQGCSSLTSVTLNATTPPTIGGGTYYGSFNGTYPIYVPAASVEAYKTANNWSNYASRIFAIEQVATVDGNPVYNYEIGVTDLSTLTDLQVTALPSGDELEIAEGVTTIQGQIGAYETVTLPSTFATFSDSDAINAATTELTCNAATPPSINRNQLGGSGLTVIYVPNQSLLLYRNAGGWSNFVSIIQPITPPQASPLFSPATQTISVSNYDELDGLPIQVRMYYTDGTEVTDTYHKSTGITGRRNLNPPNGTVEDPNEELADTTLEFFDAATYDATDGWKMVYDASLVLPDPSDPSPLIGKTATFTCSAANPMIFDADYEEVEGSWVVKNEAEMRTGTFTVTFTA